MLDRMVIASPVGKHTTSRVPPLAVPIVIKERIDTRDVPPSSSSSSQLPSSSSSSSSSTTSSYDAILRDVALLKIRATASLGVAGIDTKTEEHSGRQTAESGGTNLSIGGDGDDPPTPLAAFSVPTFRSRDDGFMPVFRYDTDNKENNIHNSNSIRPLGDPSPVNATPSTGTKTKPVFPLRSALKSSGRQSPGTPSCTSCTPTSTPTTPVLAAEGAEVAINTQEGYDRKEHPLNSDAAAAR